jgi:hypothetical protein
VAAYNKFNQFVEDLSKKVHNVATDTLKLLLTNTAPNVADTVVDTTGGVDVVKSTSNANEIAAGNGYAKDGVTITITTSSQSGGTFTLAGNQVVWTCVTAAMAAFRYIVFYNLTGGAAATRPVIAWWDYGSALTLNPGDTFTVQFNGANPGTIYTLA